LYLLFSICSEQKSSENIFGTSLNKKIKSDNVATDKNVLISAGNWMFQLISVFRSKGAACEQ
jgi:hypothetical protein